MNFTSPLKRVDSQRPLDPNSRVQKKLNFGEGSIENRVQNAGLKSIDQYPFDTPFIPTMLPNSEVREKEVRSHAAKLEGLKRQVDEIKAVLATLNHSNLTQYCHERMEQVFALDNYECQMAELGMMLFYLDSQKTLPQERSLVAVRASLIEKEVLYYIKDHQEKNLNELIPTGKTHYMMRAFAHMVLTSSQKYNRGGLFAIKELLTKPQYKVSYYLQPEHRTHILNVVDQMLTDESFDTLFSQEVVVHESLKEAIRLDLKFPRKAEIHSVHTFYACIMALFADIRQMDPPNCYAVGSLIYATENHTYIVLAKLVQSLITGHCKEVPLHHLLENRLTYNRDLDLEVMKDSILWQQMNEILELASVEREYALKFYNTYKTSALVNLQLAEIEFTHMNVQRKNGLKTLFVEDIIVAMEKGSDHEFFSNFRNKFKDNLWKRLWLENCNESNIRFDRGTLYVGTKQLKSFKGNIMKFDPLFKHSLRVYSLGRNNDYNLVWSIGDLTHVVLEAFQQTERESAFSSNANNLLLAEEAVKSSEFRKHICELTARQIGPDFQFTPKELSDADILIFNQIGGIPDEVLEEVYGIKVEIKRFERSNSPYDFLNQLLKWIAAGNLQRIKTVPKLLIRSVGDHTWTLSPSCWKLLDSHQNDFDGFINDKVFDRTDKKLDSWIPFKVRNEIINRYATHEKQRERLKNHCLNKSLTYGEFKNIILSEVADAVFMEEIIEEEFSKVRLSPEDLKDVFASLKLPCNAEALNRLYAVVGNQRTLPFVMAKKLQRALIQEGFIIDPYKLERKICDHTNMPLTIYLGDSNWINKNTEDPEHPYIVIRTSWVTSNARYCIRYSDRDRFDPHENYLYMQITFPK